MAAMQDSTPIPVAVVGVGRMGRHHARIYAELASAELVGLVDPDAERARAAAAEYGCTAFPSVEELLEQRPQVRAASIATPTVHHRAAAEVLLPRGVACLIEKPLSDSSRAARAIVDLASEHGTMVQVGHTERFNPVVRAMAELEIAPRFMEAHRISPMTFRSIDVGVVFDLMIHDLDIVLMMARAPLEEIDAVGVAAIGEHEDVANARLTFADGSVANLTASRIARKTERKLRVFSEKAYVSLDYASRTGVILSVPDHAAIMHGLRTRVASGEDLTSLDYTELVQVQEIEIPEEEPLLAELSHFLDSLREGAQPAVDAQAGWAAVDAAERVVASLRAHRFQGMDSKRLG